jgi:hypothetical protein
MTKHTRQVRCTECAVQRHRWSLSSAPIGSVDWRRKPAAVSHSRPSGGEGL